MKEKQPSARPDQEDTPKTTDEDQPPQEETKYVFKIMPVDPKNTFDFEDVADK
jgi:hypothetical protein